MDVLYEINSRLSTVFTPYVTLYEVFYCNIFCIHNINKMHSLV